MVSTTQTTKFCFDPAWSGGQPADHEAIQCVLDDMVDGVTGRGEIQGVGEDTVVIIEGDFSPDDMTQIASELSEWGMRQDVCK